MTYGLGVDLGTTFTAAAMGRSDSTEMVSLGNYGTVVPSVVFASPSGKLLTGDAADRQAAQQPDRGARQFKRQLGDPSLLMLGGAPYSPAVLLAAVLRDVVDSATRLEGAPPDRIVLSRPAMWGPYRLEQFDQVPNLAGLSNVHAVAEPVAAATCYAATRSLADGEIVAVYDLGGGTFDCAVLRFETEGMKILGTPEGVEWLGGVDFDDAILRHVDSELDGAVSAADPRNPDDVVALYRLRQECILAKEALSFDEETVIPWFLPAAQKSVRLTRARFEEMIRPAVGSTVEALHRALKSAEVRAADVSAVLLAGGSSRIPLVARMVESALGRPTVVDAHPKHVVALGSARIAASLLVPDGASVAPPRARPAEQRPGDGPPPQAATGRDGPAGTPPPDDARADAAVTGTPPVPVGPTASAPASPAAAPAPAPRPDPTAHVPSPSGGGPPPAPGTSERREADAGRWARTMLELRAKFRVHVGRRPRAAWLIRWIPPGWRRSGRPDSAPVVNRRDLVVALIITIVMLTLAALSGTLYGYVHRSKPPASNSVSAGPIAPDGNPWPGAAGR